MSYSNLENQKWFLKGSRTEAERMLESEEAGSFVIRPSSQKDCLALSHKVQNGSIGHALIHKTPQELLVLSIKKHFTVSDSKSLSTFNPSAAGGNSRLSTADKKKRESNLQELSQMMPGDRQTFVAALQLANNDPTKAADLMLSQGLYEASTDSEDQLNAMITNIKDTVPELQPMIQELGDVLSKLRTYEEMTKFLPVGYLARAVAAIKKAVAPYPIASTRPRPPQSAAKGTEGTTEEILLRFKQNVKVSVWEILSKLDGILAGLQKPAFRSRVVEVAEVLKKVREALEQKEVMPLIEEAQRASDSGGEKKNVKSDDEFYIDLKDISRGKVIGEGAYGKVYKGKFKGREVAIKSIAVKDEKELVLIRREIALLRECDHPNITELLGVSKDGDTLLLVMEFVSRGELYKLIMDGKVQEWSLRLKVCHDIASALAHVHSKNLIHRDIKSENMLVAEDWTVKLCDFGFARAVSHGVHRYTMCGSMYFNAPELLLGKPYDAKADVFAFGIFCAEVITAGKVNLERTKQTAFGLDVKSLESQIPKDCPPLFWKLAFCCATYNPLRRPSMAQVEKMLAKIRKK